MCMCVALYVYVWKGDTEDVVLIVHSWTFFYEPYNHCSCVSVCPVLRYDKGSVP